MRKLATMPGMGRKREEFTSDKSLLFWVAHKHYLVVYHPDKDPIEIVRILHTSRYVPSVFEED